MEMWIATDRQIDRPTDRQQTTSDQKKVFRTETPMPQQV